MSPAEYRVWAALRELGTGTTPQEIAEHIGRSEATARQYLRQLEIRSFADRVTDRRTFWRRLPDGWRALGEVAPPVPTTAVDAVRQVLAHSPVVGQREVARRAGYGEAMVAQALARIAIAERVGRGWQCRYRLRDAP